MKEGWDKLLGQSAIPTYNFVDMLLLMATTLPTLEPFTVFCFLGRVIRNLGSFKQDFCYEYCEWKKVNDVLQNIRDSMWIPNNEIQDPGQPQSLKPLI